MAASLCGRRIVSRKLNFLKTQYRTGYVVLIPEAPEDAGGKDLFSKSGLMADFDKLDTKELRNIMVRRAQMYDVGAWELEEEAKKVLKKKEKIDVFKNIIGPLEVLSVPFLSSWGLVNTIGMANKEYMPTQIYHPLERRVHEIRHDKFNLESVYKICKSSLEEEPNKFTEQEKRILQKFVWKGTMNGFDLDEKDKGELLKYQSIVEYRRHSYYPKYYAAMSLFKQFIYDDSITKDFPPDFLRYTSFQAEESEKGPWMVTLKPRVYRRYLEYCDSRQCRLNLWLSRRQICSKHGDPRCRADMEVEDQRHQKKSIAELHGFHTYAQMTLKSRMAENVENVQNMLSSLLEKAKIGQENEVYELEKFANSCDFVGQIEMWDVDFWARMQKKALFEFDEIALQEYFPLNQVLLGLFALCEQLFGIVVDEEKHAVAWHPDVRYFHVFDEKTKEHLGGFYLDPYVRNQKFTGDYGSGQFIPMNFKSVYCGTIPTCSLLFDFARPTEHKPSLLLFSEVQSLFFRFGEVLQHILGEASYAEVSGKLNLEWDALGICPKFLLHWLYEPSTLESVSGHYNTNEPLPSHMLDGICRMQHHMAGTKLCMDIYEANLDLELHSDNKYCMEIVERIWPDHFLFEHLDEDHHPFSMKDILFDNFACTKYCNVWENVLAADLFTAFKEAGFGNHEEISALGRRFRSTYFALAGGCHPSEVFRRFRGRNPTLLPYLDTLGLKDVTPTLNPSTEPSQISA